MAIKFRPEVSQFINQTRWKGKVLLLNRWPVWITVLLTAVFIWALIAFLVSVSYTRRINISGEVVTGPNTINLFSPVQGVVSQLWVAQGENVAAGTPLYQLDVSQITRSGNLTTSTLSAIERQQQRLDTVINQLQKSKHEILMNLQLQLTQYKQAQQDMQKMADSALEGLRAMGASKDAYASSLRKGLINTDQMNNQRYLYYQLLSTYQNLNSQVMQQTLQISSLRSEQLTKTIEFDNQLLQINNQRDELSRQLSEAEARGTRLIVAPTDGVVSLLSATPGQMVNAGDSLVQLVPATDPDYSLVIWLPDDSLPYVRKGETINIRYAAFPYEKYGQFPGRIVSVSTAPVTARDLVGWASVPRTTGGVINGAWYKAIVALDKTPSSIRLTSGMLAQATVFLEKRPLYKWILSPYYSLKKSITGPVE